MRGAPAGSTRVWADRSRAKANPCRVRASDGRHIEVDYKSSMKSRPASRPESGAAILMTLTLTKSEPAFDISPEENDFRWRRAMHDRLTALELRLDDPLRSYGSAEARDLGDILITDWCCPESEGSRSSKAVAREAESLLLFLVTTGRQIVQTPNETVVLRPGSVLLMSTRTTGRIVIPEKMTKRTVRVPLTALAPYDTGKGIPDFL